MSARRPFAASETAVAILDQAAATRLWPNEDAVGKHIRMMVGDRKTQDAEVVGVAGSVQARIFGSTEPQLYVPFAQAPNVETTPTIVVRTATEPVSLAATVRAAIAETDSAAPVDRVRTLDDFVSASVGQPRFRTWLLAALALLAVAMATIGLYGVTSDGVVQRTREFGICLAVGATAGDVIRLVLAGAARLLFTGLALGLLASAALTRTMAELLYGVTPLDLQTFTAVSVLLIAVGFLASYIPARQASRIDPALALRSE